MGDDPEVMLVDDAFMRQGRGDLKANLERSIDARASAAPAFFCILEIYIRQW